MQILVKSSLYKIVEVCTDEKFSNFLKYIIQLNHCTNDIVQAENLEGCYNYT